MFIGIGEGLEVAIGHPFHRSEKVDYPNSKIDSEHLQYKG